MLVVRSVDRETIERSAEINSRDTFGASLSKTA